MVASASASTSTLPAVAVSPRFIDDGNIELVSVIGTGAYGVVHLAIDSRYGQPEYRAVKSLRRSGLDTRQRHFQRREIALHRLASAHPSIVTMHRLIEEDEFLYVVMDYGEEGDLFAMITERQRYVGDDELIRDIFLQLLDGVHWLHQLGIAHRDIKPENIVCSEDGTRVRICDFGLATAEVESNEFGCGSTFYIAPECLGDWFTEDTDYPTRDGDVWSLGVILVNLVCGRNPWRIASPSDESFNAFLSDPHFLRRILPLSEQCLFLLTRIFTVDPSDRISLPELRKLVLAVDSFTMSEEEVRRAHAIAQGGVPEQTLPIVIPEVQVQVDSEDWAEEETVFAFDDQETPSLRADSGSPSPPTHRSRSASSNGGSLPPTPLLSADERSIKGALPIPGSQVGNTSGGNEWEFFKQPESDYQRRPDLEVHLEPASPGSASVPSYFR